MVDMNLRGMRFKKLLHAYWKRTMLSREQRYLKGILFTWILPVLGTLVFSMLVVYFV